MLVQFEVAMINQSPRMNKLDIYDGSKYNLNFCTMPQLFTLIAFIFNNGTYIKW